MSSSWTAPGASDGSAREDTPATGGPTAAPAPGGPGPGRELDAELPLFPLRPLGVGEILGAAMRIYRLRPRPVLLLALLVYGVTGVLATVATGASLMPMMSDMQATLQDPTASSTSYATGDLLATVLGSLGTTVLALVAAAVVTAPVAALAIAEAAGEHTATETFWASARRLALPAVGISLLVNLASGIALLAVGALAAVPLALTGPSPLTVLVLLLGILLGGLVSLYIWARCVLAIPVLAVEGTGVTGALRRALALTAGSRQWRVIGIALLISLLSVLAVQVIAGVVGFVGGAGYAVILLSTSGEGILAATLLLSAVTAIGTFLASALLAPFTAAGYATLYADQRMREEAFDVELGRRRRAARPGAWQG